MQIFDSYLDTTRRTPKDTQPLTYSQFRPFVWSGIIGVALVVAGCAAIANALTP